MGTKQQQQQNKQSNLAAENFPSLGPGTKKERYTASQSLMRQPKQQQQQPHRYTAAEAFAQNNGNGGGITENSHSLSTTTAIPKKQPISKKQEPKMHVNLTTDDFPSLGPGTKVGQYPAAKA